MTVTLDKTITAGGNDPTKFDPKEAWYPVYYLDDLDRAKPNKFTLLGIDLVIWWETATQSWRAFEDRCPHRLVPLSEGRINEDGLLECPYHGWSFSGEGKCEHIPQQVAGGQAETSKRACATSFKTAVAQGLLFVYPGNQENAEKVTVPIIEAMEESSKEWICLNTFRDVPYDALTLLENVIDPSHVPYTHHETVGKRSNAAPVELKVTHSDKQGLQGIWEEGPRKGSLGTQYTSFVAPCLMWHDLTSKQFGRTLTVVYATPIGKGKCRLFARFPFKFDSPIPRFFIKLSPKWYTHISNNNILEDDQIFLHHQERYLGILGGSENYSKAFYLPTKADLYISELRQWVNLYNADPFADDSFSTPLPKEQLLDRYHSHTKHCASCRGALNNIQKIKTISGVMAVIALGISPVVGLLSDTAWLSSGVSAIALLASLTWWQLSKLERKFYEGIDIPARNK
ncbi:Ring-hydroxylating dioxygenase, large terminal subunit [Hyella patelloides LEGE 07179]|uniref:Ring-hydroxylating dioxygenase, large terminal subunit n=1 Tax=Hyella patelloides LEGE 07179 TaxID=945734 RepID=A0A563VK32_9CYAN|nr:Rieske 2Fe-2S domain-containing protein [Hyella patelloides]VEP11781.1 Ring-hydroxylating dioxygenase, large terminal subunit [Hyella patelloides LEGE 07179]